MSESEEWRPVVGWEDLYEVSDQGRVRSSRGVLSQTSSHGYLFVHLCRDGFSKRPSVASLVCTAFHGARPEGRHAAHRNGIRTDNRKDNLNWLTPLENAQDKQLHDTQVRGERHPMAKITAEMALDIKRRLAAGQSQHSIAREVGVKRATVCGIALRETWAHL